MNKLEAAHKTSDATQQTQTASMSAADVVAPLREDLQPGIDGLEQSGRRLASHGKALARDAYEQTTEALQEAHERASHWVGARPWQSMAVAAATGATLAFLLGRRH
ncbi:DUF883 C-terminal domain-containing protein [Comamonas sp. NLF-1-9]|uniref:DUF883 C-terminal domain-containing protein n=1 Tax=Comamonas sp. NLF-1-9 TaxID=2853163 RepID=UPI001C48989A|nr:DUF883 C-terminal domain-containing protein [Comamonas sp. NLF-1-9]QXL84037.1 DUF883 C-terminal domain-containing protein [Comamonas sp. NLF-1-9]